MNVPLNEFCARPRYYLLTDEPRISPIPKVFAISVNVRASTNHHLELLTSSNKLMLAPILRILDFRHVPK